MNTQNVPAFIRAPKSPVVVIHYTALIYSAKHGTYAPEIDGCECILEAAKACAEACENTDDAGLGQWDRWTVREFETGKDVTAEAISELVASRRRYGNLSGSASRVRVQLEGAENSPAWWQEYDATLADWELDTWNGESA